MSNITKIVNRILVERIFEELLSEQGTANDNFHATPVLAVMGGRCLNCLEIKSVQAMIAYNAHLTHTRESTVEIELLDFLGASSVAGIDAMDYDDAMIFLTNYKGAN